LFPTWPAQDPVLAAWVFLATMGLLILPKLLAYVLLLTQAEYRRQFGGNLIVLSGILIETLLSGLIAPVMMIFQSFAVGEILLGRDAGWQVQRRDDGEVPRRETIRKYALPTVIGVLMAVSAYAVSLPLLLWMAPVIIGLLLAVPIAMVSSTVAPQSLNGQAKLFATPEQTATPKVLRRANELMNASQQPIRCSLQVLRDDRDLLAAHLRSLSVIPRIRGQVDPYLAVARAKIEDAESFDEAVGYLSSLEKFAVLSSGAALHELLELPNREQSED
jgi:membrane glycosyltransferase